MKGPLVASWHETVAGDVRWSVKPELSEALLGPTGLRLEEWLAGGRATVIKKGPHRIVYRVALADGPVIYVKHNLLGDVRTWLRQLVRPSKARIEFNRVIAVAARGIPTVEPLALGERQTMLGACESYLVTRELDNTQTLNHFLATTLSPLPPHRHAQSRQGLARALGRFVARLHDAGIQHDDLYAANILVQLGENAEPRLYLIDLSAVRLRRCLDWPASRENLVLFTRWFVPRVSRSDRLRFWRAYYETRNLGIWPRAGQGSRDHVVLARQVEDRARESMIEFWRRRDPRCFANNRYFRRVRRSGLVGHVVADYDTQVLAMLAADPDAPFRQTGVRLLKDSPSSTVAEVEWSWNGVTRRLIYKRFRNADWSAPCASLVRRAPALRAWMFGHGFRERCLPTAKPLVVLHRVRAGLPREAYLLTEKLENAVDLHVFVAHLAQLPADCARKRLRLAVDEVARALRQLHQCRLSHRDLKASNIFLANNLEAPRSPFLPVGPVVQGASISSLLPLPASPVDFIDLVGVRRERRLRRSRRMQNLARLHVSFHQSQALTRTDKLRFLRGYLLWNLAGRGNWKTWWKAIERATACKVAGNIRRGRVLG